jgi:hypothetical protein
MLEEDLNLVGYLSIVSCVVPSFSKDHHACEFRDCVAL